MLLTCGKAGTGRLTRNAVLDIIKRTDTVESLACDLGFVRGPDIMEIASPMGLSVNPQARYTEPQFPVRSCCLNRLDKPVRVAVSLSLSKRRFRHSIVANQPALTIWQCLCP